MASVWFARPLPVKPMYSSVNDDLASLEKVATLAADR